MTTDPTPQPFVLACNMAALTPEQRAEHIATSQKLFASVLEVQEQAYGYKFRLPAENAWLHEIATFISNERRCCPFLQFTVTLEPQSTELCLMLTAMTTPADIKLFLRHEFGEQLPETVARHFV